jgi:uncharacterized membrane protein YgcG
MFALSAAALGGYAIVGAPVAQEVQSESAEVSTIEAYDVDMVLKKDGTLYLDESVTVDFPISRHGIFRIFDTADPRREIEHPVDALAVTRDGAKEPWVWVGSAPGTETARIGAESVLLSPGTYTYRLISTTRDVLEPKVVDGEEDPDVTWFWWDVVGAGWKMPMQDVRVNLALPAEPLEVECVMGEHSPCEASVSGKTVNVAVESLAAKEPVTLRVSLPSDKVPANEVPSSNAPLQLGLGVLGAGAGALGLVATRERKPGYPVLYEPPPGVRPAVGARVLSEHASDDDLQATLFDLGERGVLRLEMTGADAWNVHLVAPPSLENCDEWEAAMLAALDLRVEGSTFAVSRSITAGKKIGEAKLALASGLNRAVAPYLKASPVGRLFRMLAWLCWAAVAAMAGFHFFGAWDPPGLLIAVMAGFAVGASVLAVDGGRGTVRTDEGRDVWSRTGGFARFLTTDSSESRFDAAAHLDWYPKYLPWAIALGVGEEWTRRYQAQGIAEPAVPYVTGWVWTGGYHQSGFSSFNDSFNGAISAASATYAASQASSGGGGGGGFSGGSGGGGGGGGSW